VLHLLDDTNVEYISEISSDQLCCNTSEQLLEPAQILSTNLSYSYPALDRHLAESWFAKFFGDCAE